LKTGGKSSTFTGKEGKTEIATPAKKRGRTKGKRGGVMTVAEISGSAYRIKKEKIF